MVCSNNTRRFTIQTHDTHWAHMMLQTLVVATAHTQLHTHTHNFMSTVEISWQTVHTCVGTHTLTLHNGTAGEGLCMELMYTLALSHLFYCTVTPSLTLVLSHYISTNPDPAVSVQFHNVLLQLLLMLACTDDIMAQQVRITTYGNLEMVN